MQLVFAHITYFGELDDHRFALIIWYILKGLNEKVFNSFDKNTRSIL